MNFLYIKGCESGWDKYGDKCYFFSTTEERAWQDSKLLCESMNANLVKVDTDQEHTFMRDKLIALGGDYAWIGARYNASAGEYRWIDGSEMRIDGWAPGKPNNQGCINYLRTDNWLWNSHEDCHYTPCSFICEKKAC
ncbi:C-type lectin domain family 12 member B-like [Ruditapes philippinarum]|uniref:C-type lectin domain family 12 member B-like n=1 Tax=Ruditapes philippinarum TaxID=129788 RepID=UPI00295B86FB|nr:C-type lectin domain family 12 member B-like [Ruditapes philippinarum]